MPRKRLRHNPKLDKQSDKKKKGSYQKEVDPYEEERNYRRFYMVLVFVGVVAVISTLVFVVFTQSGTRIQQYDLVRMDYRIYSKSEYQNHEEPTIEEMNTWVNVCSRYDDKCEDGLILGFYNELIGRREGDFLDYILILKCKDNDSDGWDDVYPDREALSFGNSSDLLYNKDIVLWFKIHEINVSTTEEEQTNVGWKGKEVKRSDNNNIIRYILVIKREDREFFL